MSVFHTLQFIANHPLNQGHRSAALFRFLKWQVRARLKSGPIVVPWVENTRMLVRRGDMGFTQNIYCGLHDFPEMSYLLHVLSDADLFLDVGANVGAYTVLACGVKRARGYCFEPIPATFERLQKNLAVNNLQESVKALNIGIGEGDGELQFSSNEDCMNHVLAQSESGQGSVTVPVKTLDSVVAGEPSTVMKIDVEGFETPVLKGARSVLGSPSLHSVLMELNGTGARFGYSDDWILSHMQEYGFSAFGYDPFERALLPVTTTWERNVIFVRGAERVSEVLRNALPFAIGSRLI